MTDPITIATALFLNAPTPVKAGIGGAVALGGLALLKRHYDKVDARALNEAANAEKWWAENEARLMAEAVDKQLETQKRKMKRICDDLYEYYYRLNRSQYGDDDETAHGTAVEGVNIYLRAEGYDFRYEAE